MNPSRCCKERLAWLPIPVLLTVIVALKAAGLQTAYESPRLLMLLNFVCTTLISIFVVILIGRSTLSQGTPGLLLFGCGVLFWGAAGTIGPALLSYGGNATVSTHNILAWFSALCQLAGVMLSLKPGRTLRRADLTLVLAYTATLGVVWLVSMLVMEGWTPVFFVQGNGGTPLRQFVLGSAVMMFACTAALLWLSNRRAPAPFVRWYGLAMLLVAAGLFGVMLQTTQGSLVSWAGRAAQLLGGVYMLVAALASVRESGMWRVDFSGELAEAREALRESEARYRSLFEGSLDCIFAVDTAGRLVTANPSAVRMSGYSAEELTAKNFAELCAPEQLAAMQAAFREALSGVARDMETSLISKDGRRVELYISGTPIVEAGVVRGLFCVAKDITERKKTEEAFRRSEQFARTQWAESEAVLEAVPANIAILDANGVILRVNKAWTSFAGKNGLAPDAAAVGVNYLEVCDAAGGVEAGQAAIFAAGIRSVISGEREYFSMEYPCHSRDEHRWFMGYVTATPGGGLARAVVAHVNITTQKQIEEQIRILNQELESRVVERTSELQTAVDALEGEIAERQRLEQEVLRISEHEQSRIGRDLHDGACQDLACIAVLAEFAARELDRENSQTADKAREIAGIARQSMDEVRRLAAGLFPVKIEEHGLEWALRELAAEVSARSHIKCSFHSRQPVSITDSNAAVQLYRIAQEAVSNALRHGHAGSIVIELDEKDGTASLAVRDDGSGLPEGQKNSGLGLHTMQYRAKILGGTLEISTTDPHGTTVICLFSGKELIHAKEDTRSKEEDFPG
jgi:PAS domain S-box-containing protein